jgi:hypothetical protein
MTAEGWNNIYESTVKLEYTVTLNRCYYKYFAKDLKFYKNSLGKWDRAACLLLMSWNFKSGIYKNGLCWWHNFKNHSDQQVK